MQHYKELRKEAKKNFRKRFGGDELSLMLSKIYFGAVDVTVNEYKGLLLLMKEYIRILYMRQVVIEGCYHRLV